MPFGDFLAQSKIGQRLEEHRRAQQAGRIMGLNVADAPVIGGLLTGGGQDFSVAGAINNLGLGLEAGGAIGETIAGEAVILASLAQIALGDPNHAATASARAALDQGPLRPRQALEAVRTGDDSLTAWLAGGAALVADPTNLIGGPLGKAGKGIEAGAGAASRAGRFGRLIADLDEAAQIATSAPIGVPANILKDRRAKAAAAERVAARYAGNVPVEQMAEGIGGAGVSGRPGIGPTLPPEQLVRPDPVLNLPPVVGTMDDYNRAARAAGVPELRTPPPGPPSRLVAPQDFTLIRAAKQGQPVTHRYPGREWREELARAVTPEQEAIAREAAYGPLPEPVAAGEPPSFPRYVGTRRQELAGFAPGEIDTLLRFAYDDPQAIANARAKYADPVDLADAALERLTGDLSGRRLARLQQADDPLARKVAFLPEPTEQIPEELGPSTAQFAEAIRDAVRRGAVDEAEFLVGQAEDFGLPANQARRILDDAADDGADLTTEATIAAIEQSPYFAVFKHFNPDGTLRKVNPFTGQPIVVREGGKIARGRAEVWNLEGSGYDEVAANALDEFRGDHNQNYGQSAEEFWENAQQAFRDYRALRGGAKPGYGYGDIAAGGGGMGIQPLSPAVIALLTRPAVLGALAGGTAGAGTAIAGDHDDGETLRDVAIGAGIGAVAGPRAPQLARNIGIDGAGLKRSVQAFGGAQREARQTAQASRTLGDWWRGFNAQMRSQIVASPKNLMQDPLSTRGLARERGVSAQAIDRAQAELAANYDAPTDFAKQPNAVQGKTFDLLGEERAASLGEGLINAETRQPGDAAYKPAVERILNEVAIAAGRTRGPVSLGRLLIAPLTGYLRPGLNAAFNEANAVSHMGTRFALFERELDRQVGQAAGRFLDELRAAGVDVTPLEAKGAYFSPQDVLTVAGGAESARWADLAEYAFARAEQEAKHVFGDFGRPTWFEEHIPLVSRLFFLAGWSQRMLPVYLETLARHPGAALNLLETLETQGEQMKDEGLPPWYVGSVPIPGTDRRADLASLITGPVSPDISGLFDTEGRPKNAYERATGIGDAVGIGVHPAVGTLAYIAGLSNRRPGDLDRLAGLSGQLPGPDLPNLYGQGIDRAREGVDALMVGAGLRDYPLGLPATPIERRMAEIAFAETGLPLSDPSNRGWLAASLNPESDLYRRASADVERDQAASNAISFTSPVVTQRDNPLANAGNKARDDLPWDKAFIDGARAAGREDLARYYEMENQAHLARHPEIAAYYGITSADRTEALVRDFNARHPGLERRSPRSYRMLLAEFIAQQLAQPADR